MPSELVTNKRYSKILHLECLQRVYFEKLAGYSKGLKDVLAKSERELPDRQERLARFPQVIDDVTADLREVTTKLNLCIDLYLREG